MSEPSLATTWRLTRGRHRVAMQLSACLLALSLAATVVRAMADAFAALPLLGGPLDGVDRMLRMPVPPALAAFALVIAFSLRIHPALAPAYLAGLTTTPWRPGRRLPLGDVGLVSTFVELPAVAIAIATALRQPSTLMVALGASIGYGAVAIFAGLVTRHAAMPLALAMLMVGLIPAATAETTVATPLLLTAIVVTSGLAQRSILAAAFGRDGVADVRRMAIQKRSTLGWFENLPLTRKPRSWRLELLTAIATGAIVTMVGTATESWDAAPWRGLLTAGLFVTGSVRFGFTFANAPLSYGPIARVLTARWFVPRMDRLLLFPALMLGLIGLLNVVLLTPRSTWNPTIAGGCVAIAAMLCWWVAPSAIAWQTTGTCRIATVANKQQKQAEASLKRLTDPQSNRAR